MNKILVVAFSLIAALFCNMAIAGSTECNRVGDKLRCVMLVDPQRVEVEFSLPGASATPSPSDIIQQHSGTVERLNQTIAQQQQVIADLQHEVKLVQSENLDLVVANIQLKAHANKVGEMYSQLVKKYNELQSVTTQQYNRAKSALTGALKHFN